MGAGIIPAHAGKTRSRRWCVDAARDHPRSRGENVQLNRAVKVAQGSSPLTRGKRRRRKLLGRSPGIIPAHAGKTVVGQGEGGFPGDHPRSRGENLRSAGAVRFRAGSSPLTRGKRSCRGRLGGCLGIIPAHAGKTVADAARASRWWDHPRSRGENARGAVYSPTSAGSSPLTRGKRTSRRRLPRRRGIIPAHAGKTLWRGLGWLRWGDHPRSRGENDCATPHTSRPSGSSPLTRGKRRSMSLTTTPTGIIPAHAGKTLPDLRFYRADRSDLGKP